MHITGKNGFGLKYLDTSSLEFGRKIDKDSEKYSLIKQSADASKVEYDSKNTKTPDKTISSSSSVSSSETIQIETSLSNQDLVKQSRVKKRNFSSKDPIKSERILKSHINSNNFRHTSKSDPDQSDSEVIIVSFLSELIQN